MEGWIKVEIGDDQTSSETLLKGQRTLGEAYIKVMCSNNFYFYFLK
jgi:hypothetical protein